VPGYLSHLAARVSGVRPTVRPRIPSLFETAPGTALPVASEPGGVHVIDQERIAAHPPALRPAAASDSPQPAVHAVPMHASEPIPAPVKPHPPTLRPVETETEAAPPPAARALLQAQDATLAESAPPAPPRVAVRQEPQPVAAQELTSSVGPTPRPPVRSIELEPQQPSRMEGPLPLNQLPRREEPRIEPPRPVPESTLIAQQQPVPPAPIVALQPELRPAQRTPAFREGPPHEPPAVQVSIGRLIVEAVVPAPAATPQPAPRPTTPRLTLDDYLRQRRSQA
jgi:hypothetical protein